MADVLAIEEANKIRKAMGMALLPVPGQAAGPTFKAAKEAADPDEEPASTLETREAAGWDNWKKLQDDRDAKGRREAKAAAIKKEREKAQRYAKLEGKSLADEAEDVDDLAWVKKSKRRQKEIAKAEQAQREFEEQEKQALLARQYSEADLAGVKVGHELDAFGDGEDQILVLKDTAVDADEDDELEAVALKEQERLQERLDSKKRKRVYDPNEADEGGQHSILAQYDEEIDGKKRKAFTLDGQGTTVESLKLAASEGASKPKKVAISLDILKDDAPANDSMDISEVKVKKPKKKKSKSSRRKHVEDEGDAFQTPADDPAEEQIQDEAMDVEDDQPVVKKVKKNFFDESFVDDDDLQAQLAVQRRQALKKRKRTRPEDLARQLREEASATPEVVMDTTEATQDDDGPGLVIDETTVFVQNLQRSKTEEQDDRRPQSRKSRQPSHGMGSPDPDGDVDMNESYAEAAEAEDHAESRARGTSVNLNTTGIDDEDLVEGGLGATMRLLKSRGLVADASSGDLNAIYRERQKFLADKQRAEGAAERIAKEQRERERQSSRWNQMNTKEREDWSRKKNSERDAMESRKLAEIFNKEYKPNVQLNYVDEHGRQMNQKEAFKHLSHQFHGKGSGNNKTQKYLEKVEAEKKKMSESSLEATLKGGMSNALDQQSRKRGQAGVRLQ
ncbi:SART-1 protein [Clohesyomyces aquaticus]|uniref:SART-1 protein n=1 Tax=Clohesyomyces aquaticus TaxID=1231657 RepID=A0A1Y2A938_9PLEO|nr:SART-1 protein [Clohesyomyces aquaticus]